MAVRSIKEVMPKKKRRHISDYIWSAVVVFFIVFCVIGVSVDMRQTSAINDEIDDVNTQISDVQRSNSEIREILDSGDYSSYIEKIAREDHGYCSPGEEVFYNNLYGE